MDHIELLKIEVEFAKHHVGENGDRMINDG